MVLIFLYVFYRYSATRWEAKRLYAADCLPRWENHVFVQKAQMIVWPGNLHSRIPGQTQLMLAQKSRMMRQLWLPPHLLTQHMLHRPLSRHMAMVHTVEHTHQELKLSMLQMVRLVLYPISTRMQGFMDSSLPTKSSFVSGTETTIATWRWACWPEQPQAWPWGLCSGSSSRVHGTSVCIASDTPCAII